MKKNSLFYLILVVIFLGVIFSTAKADIILGEKVINIAGGFSIFLGLQIFFLILSLSSFLICLLSFFIPERKWGNRGLIDLFLFLSSIVGTLIVKGFDLFVLCKEKLRKISTVRKWVHYTDDLPDNHQITDKNANVPQIVEGWNHKLKVHRYPLFFFAGICTHLFWVTLTMSLVLILFGRMYGNRYDYCWKTSITSQSFAQKITRYAGSPIKKIVTVPDQEHIRWLFENSEEDKQQYQPFAMSDEVFRLDWSRFLLALLITWALTPRVILLLLYYLFFRLSLRRIQQGDIQKTGAPDEFPRFTQEKEKIVDSEPEFLDLLSPPSMEKTFSPSETETSDSIRSEEPATPWIFLGSYDINNEKPMRREQWEAIFHDDTNRLIIAEDLALRSRERDTCLKELQENSSSLILFALLLDTTLPPARQTLLFLQNHLFTNLTSAIPVVVFLSCTERLRKKFPADSDAVSQRLQEWKKELKGLGDSNQLTIMIIDDYDHELDTADARRGVIRRITPLYKKGEVLPSLPEKEIKIPRACSIIKESIFQLGNGTNPVNNEHLANTISTGYKQLLALYREEELSFNRSIEQNGPDSTDLEMEEKKEGLAKWNQKIRMIFSMDTLKQIDPSTVDKEALFRQLSPILPKAQRIKEIASHLSPKSAIICGSVAATLPLVTATIPLLGGAVGIGTVVSLFSGLPASMISAGTLGAAAGAFLPKGISALNHRVRSLFSFPKTTVEHSPSSVDDLSEEDSYQTALETLLLSLTTWLIIFEYQPISPETLPEKLDYCLTPFEENSLSEQENAFLLLEDVVQRIQTDKKDHKGE